MADASRHSGEKSREIYRRVTFFVGSSIATFDCQLVHTTNGLFGGNLVGKARTGPYAFALTGLTFFVFWVGSSYKQAVLLSQV